MPPLEAVFKSFGAKFHALIASVFKHTKDNFDDPDSINFEVTVDVVLSSTLVTF